MRVLFSISIILSCAGCGGSSSSSTSQPGVRGPEITGTTETSPYGDPIAEASGAGWPHTTKKHAGELIYVAPDGTEQITDLGDDTVAHITKTFREAEPDEVRYELHYLRHRNGNDLYQLDYSWKAGANVVRESRRRPITYTGTDETTIATIEHGTFEIHPISK